VRKLPTIHLRPSSKALPSPLACRLGFSFTQSHCAPLSCKRWYGAVTRTTTEFYSFGVYDC
jgi:hypothetical protein